MSTSPDETFLSVALRPCTASVLRFVGRGEPWTVWFRRHRPLAAIRWWRTRLAIDHGSEPRDVVVRDLELDLQVPRAELDDMLPHFEDHGVEALFMTRPVPDTLTLHGLDHEATWRVLRSNGCRARFMLPAPSHVAVLAGMSRSDLDAWKRAGLDEWIQSG